MISESEIEQPRSAQDLLPWVEMRMDEIGQTKEGKDALRYLKGGCKQLAEEVYPLAIWASGLERPEHVTIEPKVGSQNFDAVVTMHDGNHSFHVEVTQAHKGDQEHYRRLLAEQQGWAPGPSHDVIKRGTKARGIEVEQGRILTSVEAVKRKCFELITDAIQRKLKKEYPVGSRLLVAFEDIVVARADRINEQLLEVVEAATEGRVCSFTHIHLVGMNRRLAVDWQNGRASS
ncbi:hypothetical protein ACW9IK_00235 [Pseudomonas gingeri]